MSDWNLKSVRVRRLQGRDGVRDGSLTELKMNDFYSNHAIATETPERKKTSPKTPFWTNKILG